MDSTRFDEFTKALAKRTSRRQALKTLAATTVGGIFGLSRVGHADARLCRDLGQNCSSNAECCSSSTTAPAAASVRLSVMANVALQAAAIRIVMLATAVFLGVKPVVPVLTATARSCTRTRRAVAGARFALCS